MNYLIIYLAIGVLVSLYCLADQAKAEGLLVVDDIFFGLLFAIIWPVFLSLDIILSFREFGDLVIWRKKK